jgi:hypothetical protein
MATNKHTNLTVNNLTVTGTYTGPEAAPAAASGPVAPHPLPLPKKPTMAALEARVEFLTGVLVEAGLIHPVPRETVGE